MTQEVTMAFVTVIVLLSLVEYFYFGMAVGRSRAAREVEAPAVTGDATFERFFRAHQNTLEQLVIFIPAMYAAGYYASGLLAVALGVVFLIARALYFRGYVADPQRRGVGMILTVVVNVLLLLCGLVGAVRYALAG